MRVLLQADMEGISQLVDGREILPCYEEYWRTGLQRMTADVVAASMGLLEGGATEVVVWDLHGSGRKNIRAEDLPDGVRLVGSEAAFVAANAVDGNSETRWSSAFADPQWIYIDLGQAYKVNHVRLNWEAACAKSYQIQLSIDKVNWTTVYTADGSGKGGIEDITFTDQSARYVKMYGWQRATRYSYSLWEFEVYGSSAASSNLALNRPVYVSSTESGGSMNQEEHFRKLPYGAYDGVFQVGYHARCGTKDGFLAHTHVPNLRLALDGVLITESHKDAWDAAVPVLGIVGDAALERELTGTLEGTPFLAVKRGPTRWQTTPIYPNEVASNAAIRTFATRCAREWQERKAPQLPQQFTLAVCMPSELTAEAVGQRGLERQSASVLSVTCKDWWKDAQPALDVAMMVSRRPGYSLMEGMDFSSEETSLQAEPVKMERLRSFMAHWFETDDSDWCE